MTAQVQAGPAAMPFMKMFIEQFTYWAPGINVIYLFT